MDVLLNMIRKNPNLIVDSLKKITRKLELLANLGYSKKEIYIITKTIPGIFSLADETILSKITILEDLGFTNSQAKKIIKKTPSIIGYSKETITYGEVGIVVSYEM